MKGTKKYSKSTHKKAIDTEGDPYLAKIAPNEAAECRKCGVFYINKRWVLAEESKKSGAGSREFKKVLCPACQKIKDRYVGGYVSITGPFQAAHRDEIINLIKNKEKVARSHNPLDRIMDMKDSNGGLEITTTTEKLAQRIGQILKKSFHGEVEYKWSSDVKLARVRWTR
ncbi:MAG: BCAM0308 family protein [Thermodesulfobacteriota bacterium]